MFLYSSFLGKAGGAAGGVTEPGSMTAPPTAAAYVSAVDIDHGWRLYEKSADTSYSSPMSLVKMATALILMEHKSAVLASETVTITSDDVDVTGTTANLTAGDVLTWEHLLYGLMVPSGNDAALAIARVIGTEIHDAVGSGNTGVTRFIEEMNAKTSSWGLSSTTFASPNGVDSTALPSGGTNPTTAHDISVLAGVAFSDATIQTVASTASHTMVITGTNARSYSVSSGVALINGPIGAAAGLKMDGILAAKGGTKLAVSNLCVLWQSPAGNNIVITVMGGNFDIQRILDMTSLIFEIIDDYPYLIEGTDVGTDAQWAKVVCMAGAESGYVDESSYARTLTNNGASLSTTNPVMGSQSYSFNGTSSRIEIADAAELSFGSNDFAVEFYFRGDGSAPSGNAAFVAKWNTTSNQREWTVQYDATNKQLVAFVSSTGANFPFATFALDSAYVATVFNGAKRHILVRRSSGVVSIYLNGHKGDTDTTLASLFSGTSKMMIGARAAGAGAEFFLSCQIDELRVTNDDPRQTAAMFTPTGRPYPRAA